VGARKKLLTPLRIEGGEKKGEERRKQKRKGSKGQKGGVMGEPWRLGLRKGKEEQGDWNPSRFLFCQMDRNKWGRRPQRKKFEKEIKKRKKRYCCKSLARQDIKEARKSWVSRRKKKGERKRGRKETVLRDMRRLPRHGKNEWKKGRGENR